MDLSAYRNTAVRRSIEKIEQRKRRGEQTREVAERMATMLRDQFGASRVVLFGSVAREEGLGAYSDVDLAVQGLSPMAHLEAVA